MAVDLGAVSSTTTSAATIPGSGIGINTTGVAPVSSSGSGDPTSIIGSSIAAAMGGVSLQYNTTLPKYYMALKIGTYARGGSTVSQITTTFNQGTVILPLPETLVDTHGIKYSEAALGSLTGFITGQAQDAWNKMPSSSDPNRFSKTIDVLKNKIDTSAGSGLTALGLQVAQNVGGPIVEGIQTISGYSPNQFLTILFGGPTYKRHQFIWKFSPRNAQESTNLNNILNLLHNSAAPAMSTDGLLFKFPKIFQILIYPNSKYLMKFKPSVLESIAVDFNGGGFPSFFRPGNDGLNAPTVVTLNLQFHELEFWLSGNYSGSNDPTDVEKQTDAFANPIFGNGTITDGLVSAGKGVTNLLGGGTGGSAPGLSPGGTGP